MQCCVREKMTKRFEMRCTQADFKRWEKQARKLGLPSVATYLRIAANKFQKDQETIDGGP